MQGRPRVRIAITFRIKGREAVTVRPYLDTVVLDTLGPIDHRELSARDPKLPPPPAAPLVVELVWRAAVLAPRRLADAEIVVREEVAK